jgi:glycosyltransferase involved in cell wall biosynthesis
MNEFFKKLSVIIPFTQEDLTWKDLLQDLIPLSQQSEILLVGPDAPDFDLLTRATVKLIAQVKYVESPKGRAVQLNTGARAAHGEFFWFLHADSKVPRPSIFLLKNALANKPGALHYFDLQYLPDGPKWVGLNSLGANMRSRYLGMPFGDQGFALSRAVFSRLGGFSEKFEIGEDHAFVWEARRKRIELNRVPAPIFTSARKYETEGWGRVTRQRLLFTARLAAAECLKLLKQRIIESV